MRIPTPLIAGSAALFVTLSVAPAARAFERQWHAGADLGWAAVSWRDSVRSGFGGGLHLAYGLSDSYNVLVELSGSTHSVEADQPNLTVLSGAAGMAYTLDVLTWVPYAGLLVGGYRFDGVRLDKAENLLGFQAALGLDYRPSTSWALGVQLRYHTFSDDPFQAHYMTSFARFEVLWGW